MTLIPTPPAPNTTTLEPGTTFAVLIAEPTPVITPQPMSDAISYGTSDAIFCAAAARTTISSANVPVPAIPKYGVPPTVKRAFMNESIVPVMQRLGCPPMEWRQSPQGGTQQMITWSPTATLVTPSPTSTTSPAPSCPGTSGLGCGRLPRPAGRSQRPTP